MIAPKKRRKRNPWRPEYLIEIYDMAREGLSHRQMALELEVDPDLFAAWVDMKREIRVAIKKGAEQSLSNKLQQTHAELKPELKAFLVSYAKFGNICEAAIAAGISRDRHYYAMRTDEGYPHAFQMAEEEASDRLEGSARRKAMVGLRQYKFTKGGAPIMIECSADHPEAKEIEGPDGPIYIRHYYERKYSDGLHAMLLKAAKREKYADRQEVKVEHTGDVSVSVSHAIEQVPEVVDGEVVGSRVARLIAESKNGHAE